MKIKDQKALAKYIIDYIKKIDIFREVNTQSIKERIVVNINKAKLENAIYCAIASWNAEEIELLMMEIKKARESGEFYK